MCSAQTEVARIDLPTPSAFAEVIAAREPVIIRGVTSHWKAPTAWTLDYLQAKIQPHMRELRVIVSQDGNWVEGQRSTMLTADFFAALAAGPADQACSYRPQIRLDEDLPELMADVTTPAFLRTPSLAVTSTNLWLGNSGNWTRTHWDVAENLIAQIRGDKHVTLVSADDERLPRHPWNSPRYNQSTLADLNAYQPERHPESERLTVRRCTLRPGDALYVPSLWWHCLRGSGLNMSVNSWFSAYAKAEMHAWAAIRQLAEHFSELPAFHRAHICRYLSGRTAPTPERVMTLNELLGLPQSAENAS